MVVISYKGQVPIYRNKFQFIKYIRGKEDDSTLFNNPNSLCNVCVCVSLIKMSIGYQWSKLFLLGSIYIDKFVSLKSCLPPNRITNISNYDTGGIRGTVVARWTAGQQVEPSNLRQGHNS